MIFLKETFIRNLHVEDQKTLGTSFTKGPITKELYNNNIIINGVDMQLL